MILPRWLGDIAAAIGDYTKNAGYLRIFSIVHDPFLYDGLYHAALAFMAMFLYNVAGADCDLRMTSLQA
jgi:hypothetical protein